ncbi:uncharacterized protein F5Z01DRAFT_487258 [Emericellopsis atlantica]|uniref:Uncharacterized protein n=1 Tax=Emericellopsis atlantica TaxID=2614577 RepID=A0A9P7ZR28_9HYPO|nr:uncharacterized protein F5Z01DRAFT_487258 [Emericellopsis atlantica]KAG9256748.1 hypothetical protein F5Z01DRAFT_487258 [Emericellopsis atlantica]
MLFQKHILLICHALLVIAQNLQPRMQIPGVGFSLTPDHGVAAIFYKNKTWAEVARVEGSSTYKALMRKAPSTELVPDQRSSWRAVTDVVCPVLDTFKPELCKRNPDVESAKDLLRNLKAAVASRLGTTFCYTQIALPDRKWAYQLPWHSRAVN